LSFTQIKKICRGEIVTRDRFFDVVFPEGNDLVRLLVWKRAQEHTIDDAEDGDVCSDPKGKGNDRNQRVCGMLQKHSRAESYVLPNAFHLERPSLCPVLSVSCFVLGTLFFELVAFSCYWF
jgi:hypothetical protein